VWSAILDQVDRPGSESAFVSVADSPREAFHRHPWSIGGGGAAQLKERLEMSAGCRLGRLISAIGRVGATSADEVMMAPRNLHELVAGAERVLNIDGYGILTHDEALGEVALD